MRRFSLLFFVICLSTQIAYANQKGYITGFTVGNRAAIAAGQAIGTALTLAFGGYAGGAGQTRQDYAVIISTPAFRTEALDIRNAAAQKDIDKLNKNLEKARSKGKNTAKLEAKAQEYRYQLLEDPNWNSDKDAVSFILVPLYGGLAQPITDFKVSDKAQQASLCTPSFKQEINFSDRDKEYLAEVYGINLHKKVWTGYKASFEPACLIRDVVSTYIVSFNSNPKYHLDLDFSLNKKDKDIIRDDFNILN